jgi:redox-sensing transcriptional repressor
MIYLIYLNISMWRFACCGVIPRRKCQMADQKIPQVTAKRLPLYYRYLEKLHAIGKQRISSADLSDVLQIDPATIRRDFSYLGELGKKGYGYNVTYLLQFLRDFLKQDEVTNVVLVGVGNLGTALLRYNFYRSHNIKIVAGFDQDIVKVGSDIDGIPVYAMDRLKEVSKLYDVEVAILTVPVSVAQCTLDFLVEAGIRGVLNFTPARLVTPPYVRIHHIDLTVELQTLVYFLKNFPAHEEDETGILSHP